jgi:glucokinase
MRRRFCVVKARVIGIDIGATAVKGALFDEAGTCVRRDAAATLHASGKELFVGGICDLINLLAHDTTVEAVGIGIAGMLDRSREVLFESPNMPGIKNLPLKSMLEQQLRIPVVIENDANMAALGELHYGAGRGLSNFLLCTLGTGVGSGLILDGHLWRGEQGRAGEFGHLTVYPDGELCGCGKRGCLEAYSSGSAIVRMARAAARGDNAGALRDYAEMPSAITPERVYDYAFAGDAACREIFRTMARALAIAVADVAALLDINVFIIGGGVSRAYDFFSPMVMKEIEQHVFSSSRGHIRLLRAQLDNDAGVCGAGLAAREALNRC